MAKFQQIDEAAFKRLASRSKRLERHVPFATKASFDKRQHRVKLRLSNGLELSFDPSLAPELMSASDEDLTGIEIGGAGGSIYFPRLDADFSVSRLLEGFFGPMDWARRERRAAASRENGKLGGRPTMVAAQAEEKIKLPA